MIRPLLVVVALAGSATELRAQPSPVRTVDSATISGVRLSGAIDSEHITAKGGTSANNLGVNPGTEACSTSTQSSTSMLCIRGNTGSTAMNPFLVNINLDSYSTAGDPVTLYAGNRIHSGAPQGWALNTVTHLEPGAGGGIGYEVDLNNWACDAGSNGLRATAGCTTAPPVGLLITGSSPYASGSAIIISGVSTANSQWHDGIQMLGPHVADRYSIYTNNASQIDYELAGVHLIGLDFAQGAFTQAAIRLRSGQAVAWLPPLSGGNVHTLTSTATTVAFGNVAGPTVTIDDTNGMGVTGGLAIGGQLNSGGTIVINTSQRICWVSGQCIGFTAAGGKLQFFANKAASTPIASLDRGGNMVLIGKLTQHGTP